MNEAPMKIQSVAIIGLGLLGGSVGLALEQLNADWWAKFAPAQARQ